MFKVYVDTGEPKLTTNALTFATVPDAIRYARDLYSRWTLVRGWYVVACAAVASIPVSVAERVSVAWGTGDLESIPTASDAVSPRNGHGEHPSTFV